MAPLHLMVVTTSRADYGLLSPLLKAMAEDSAFKVDLVACGSHLSPLHGYTVDRIKEDGFRVAYEIETFMEDDSEDAISQSVANGLSRFSPVLRDNPPDALVLLGDRYELWSFAVAAVIHKIPIVHIHGGEATFGAFDDSVRHCISKMAAIHFPSIEPYGQRLIQMGEHPDRVFVVGALGIDNIRQIGLLDQDTLSRRLGVDFGKHPVAMMTFHPVTLDGYELAAEQVRVVLDALLEQSLQTVMTMPNADPGGVRIFEMIESYLERYPQQFRLMKNMGQQVYLSAMQHASVMVGNSSSGIIESASFRLPVVNIGDRQAGRFKPANVIDCANTREAITDALEKALSPAFRESVSTLENPYGKGDTAKQMLAILKRTDFSDKEPLLKKGFYDLPNIPQPVTVSAVR